MKTLIQAVVSLFAASAVHAQQAVQWRVEDGGNGHWYGLIATSCGADWNALLQCVADRGGDLAAINSAAESEFVSTRLVIDVPGRGSLLGAFVEHPFPDFPQSALWTWSNGEPWTYTNWCCPTGSEQFIYMFDHHDEWPRGTWDDCYWGYVPTAVIEWSADCNNDGIVDYGQILTGQLADTNSNGVPDACEVVTCRDADFFPDRNVNGADLGLLLSQWGPATQYTVADLNRDGTVDGADLGIVLSFWGPCPY